MRNSKIAIVLVGKHTGQPGIMTNQNFEDKMPHVDLFLPNVKPESADDNCIFGYHPKELLFIEDTFNVDLVKGKVLFHQDIQ